MPERQSIKQEMDDYQVQQNTYVDCARFFAKQGFAFQEHDEFRPTDEENFLELLKLLGNHNEQIGNAIFENATKTLKLTPPGILKDIVNVAAKETNKDVIAELGDEMFSVFFDVSSDVYRKEQMTVIIRFVNKRGAAVERFLGIVPVSDTAGAYTVDTAVLSLKTTLENLFGKHGLTLSRLRGQCYDRAFDNIDEFKGLKTLIMRENASAYYVHCFADQLQRILVAVSRENTEVGLFFQKVCSIIKVVWALGKKCDRLRDKRAIEVVEALSNDEILIGIGLNQETNPLCAHDTRSSSHLKALNSVITLFSATIDVIEEVENGGSFLWDQRAEARGVLRHMQSFEFVFNCHLLRNSLLITYDLSQFLQHKDLDLVNAMCLVKIAKSRLQKMRDSGWESLFQEVCAFCEKHNIEIPNMEDLHVDDPQCPTNTTNLHYYRVDMFYTVIDVQLRELNDRFTETNIELLICMSCLDPNNTFSSFNKDRLLQLA
ncbi:uncharacterized protein LOC144566387 [Carex rostrata]